MPFCKTGADLGGGCRGCAPPPPTTWDGLRFSNTTGSLQKKKLCGFGVEVEQADECTPSLNKILDPPLQNTVEPKGLLKRFYLNDHKLRKIFVCGTRNPELWSPEYSRAQGIRNSTNDCNPKSSTWIPESKTVLDLFYMGRQKKET